MGERLPEEKYEEYTLQEHHSQGGMMIPTLGPIKRHVWRAVRGGGERAVDL